jgi:hypothetical protein
MMRTGVHREQPDGKPDHQASLPITRRPGRLASWAYEVATGRLAWSEEVREIHEAPADVVPMPLDALRHIAPVWRSGIVAVFNACATVGTAYDEELQIISWSGRRVWTRVTGQAIRDVSGAMTMCRARCRRSRGG